MGMWVCAYVGVCGCYYAIDISHGMYTCSVIWGLLDKDDDPRASHELLNTEKKL